MNKINVSAPGKLMLLGEHAVVYDHPCLVTAVDKRMRATVELLDNLDFQLETEDVKVIGYKKPLSELGRGDIPKGAKFVEVALANLLSRSRNKFGMTGKKGIKITTRSEFSSQFGFGSSSASTVCIGI
jgi:mevalonate kinase